MQSRGVFSRLFCSAKAGLCQSREMVTVLHLCGAQVLPVYEGR